MYIAELLTASGGYDVDIKAESNGYVAWNQSLVIDGEEWVRAKVAFVLWGPDTPGTDGITAPMSAIASSLSIPPDTASGCEASDYGAEVADTIVLVQVSAKVSYFMPF